MSLNNRKIVLVAGTGRCGTTIVNKILEKHPLTVVSPPWRFMIDPDGVLDFLSSTEHEWSPYFIDIRYKRLKQLFEDVEKASLPKFFITKMWPRKLAKKLKINLLPRYAHLDASDFCPDFNILTKDFLSNILDFSYQANWVGSRFLERNWMAYIGPNNESKLLEECTRFYHSIIDNCLNFHDGEIFVDRNTWNHLKFDKFLMLDNEIKLLHICRDPRDVVASFSKQNWMPQDAIHAAKVYRDLTEAWGRIRDKVPSETYMDIQLENLVENPKAILTDVCSYLDIDWNDALLDVPLLKSNTGRWKNDIPIEQQDEVEKILKPALQYWGYQ